MAPTPLTLLLASRSLGSQPASLTLPMLMAPTPLTLLRASRSLGSQLASLTLPMLKAPTSLTLLQTLFGHSDRNLPP
ncbi:Hypothetical protein NTJ_15160 [Nesidiocoris tenuis]|uniref:Secreted protein n=1 Tax=Nesidiocoris tenuis TaxID=355587 RepID=A0ABN7BD91_9HEMI|nr:Hypothetical protein NTJ_15160 [Nesidiocoris tenuis]